MITKKRKGKLIWLFIILQKYSFFFRWNQLDVVIVILSIVGIVLEEVESKIIPINPTIIRVMRVLRIARGQCSKLNNFNQ